MNAASKAESESLLADAWAYRQACATEKLTAFVPDLRARFQRGSTLWPALDAVSGKRDVFYRRAEAKPAVQKLGNATHRISIDTLNWLGQVDVYNSHVQRIEVRDFVRNAQRYGDELTDYSTLGSVLVCFAALKLLTTVHTPQDVLDAVVNVMSVCEKADRPSLKKSIGPSVFQHQKVTP